MEQLQNNLNNYINSSIVIKRILVRALLKCNYTKRIFKFSHLNVRTRVYDMKYKKTKHLLTHSPCRYILLINHGFIYGLICLITKKVKISFVKKENIERQEEKYRERKRDNVCFLVTQQICCFFVVIECKSAYLLTNDQQLTKNIIYNQQK